jgi:hypothetical protein
MTMSDTGGINRFPVSVEREGKTSRRVYEDRDLYHELIEENS